MPDAIQIRPARPEDMPAVFSLVEELAHFERAPHEVETSPASYLADGFGTQPAFACLVAETTAAEVVGIALYYFGFSTWKGRLLYLDDLVVREAYRQQGIGRRLMAAVIAEAHRHGVRQMRWQVLDWNTPAIDFYRSLEAEIDTGWYNCKLSQAQIARLAGAAQD